MNQNGLLNDLQNQKITVRLFLFKIMGNKNLIKRFIFKEKISELKSKKFSFEIIELSSQMDMKVNMDTLSILALPLPYLLQKIIK